MIVCKEADHAKAAGRWKAFFPNVLLDQSFQTLGYCSLAQDGNSSGLNWAVFDPRRLRLDVWRKLGGEDFVDAAKGRRGTIVTNGPFFGYSGGTAITSVAKIAAVSLFAVLRSFTILNPTDRIRMVTTAFSKALRSNFSASMPTGHLHSMMNGIHETRVSAANLDFFGRGGGGGFQHYICGSGKPPMTDEVIGGLLPGLRNYQIVSTATEANQFGFWGLAPLDPTMPIWGPDRQALEAAMENYSLNDSGPYGEPLTGLLITAFHDAEPAVVLGMLKAANVRDAVQLDGSDSVLLVVDGTVFVGNSMEINKRIGNTWGFEAVLI